MIKTIDLTDAQHIAWDKFCDDRAVMKAREQRFLEGCARDLGISTQWQFDEMRRSFVTIVPDETDLKPGD